MQNINVVVLTANLTRDPSLNHTTGGTPVCSMRVAVNGRRKNSASGEWEDTPNYFDVTVFGTLGENCKKYLAKGRPVAIEGRLDWREWEAKDGSKRQAVQIIANNVQFLGKKPEDDEAAGDPDSATAPEESEDRQLAGVGAGGGGAEDDIPF